MLRTLLLLAAIGSQAFSLLGSGFVLCLSRDGGICVEYLGQGCTCCSEDRHDSDAPKAHRGCGCCHDTATESDEIAPAGLKADDACDCQHIPLADREREPCVLAAPVVADQHLALMFVLLPIGSEFASAAPATRSLHDPPDREIVPSAHLSQLAGVILRC